MSVPNTFASATSAIPLANLDADFAYYDAAFQIAAGVMEVNYTFRLEDPTDNTKKAEFVMSGITTGTTRQYTLPNATGTLATLANTSQTFTGSTVFAPSTNSGTVTIGGIPQTGTITLGRSTASQTVDIAVGATTAASTKTVNIGTTGVSTSTTNLNYGSAVTGALVTHIWNAGANNMRLDSAGNLGIGAATPFGKLNITNGAGKGFEFWPEIAASTNALFNYDRTGGTYQDFQIRAATHQWLIGSAEKMRLDASGRLGIGTTSPTSPLQVATSNSNAYGAFIASAIGTTNIGNGARAALVDNGVGGGLFGNWYYSGVSDKAAETGYSPRIELRTSDGSIRFSSSTSVAANTTIAWSEKMRLDADGDLGIGTTSPGAKLHVSGTSTTAEIRVQSSSTVPALSFYSDSASAATRNWAIASSLNTFGDLAFQQSNVLGGNPLTAGTTRMTLDASGNLGIGTTSPTGGAGYQSITLNGGANGAIFDLQASGTTYARLLANNTFTRLGTETALPLLFYTNSAEKMRLDASGNLLVGTTSVYNSARVSVLAAGGSGGIVFSVQNNNDTYYAANFRNTAGTSVGSISCTTSATAYVTSSDYRLKNITGPITNSGAYIDSLKPVEGTWKADGSTFVGLIAHETQEVSRTTVATGTKDGEQMQGMDYSSAEIIANLIAELQSLRARVAQLESK